LGAVGCVAQIGRFAACVVDEVRRFQMSIDPAGWHMDAGAPSWTAGAKTFSFYLCKAGRERVLCNVSIDALNSSSLLELLDTAYPADTAIEIIRDKHTAHVSREITAWLAAQPSGRFTFTFTPTHASWLTPIEGFLSKLARSTLRPIRVASKHELKKRLLAFSDDLNREPILHSWRYKIDNTA
jgi:transposase